MKKLSDYRFIIIFVIVILMALFFPLTGEDLIYHMSESVGISEFLNLPSNGILSNILNLIFTKFKFLRVLSYGVIGTFMFCTMKNTVNKHNGVLMFVALFFIFLMDKAMFSASIINAAGFYTHFIGSLMLIIFINLINKNSIFEMRPIVLVILGFISTCLNLVYGVVLFIIILIYMFKSFKEKYTKGFLPLIIGMFAGLVLTILTSTIRYTGFSYNILHEFIPKVQGMNFLIVLIFSALLLFLSIKVFMRESRIKTSLAMLGITIYLCTMILNAPVVIAYFAYFVHIASCFYILMHVNKSTLFKRKVCIYYIFKVAFIIISCIFGNIYEGSLLFLYLVDILLILELYNYLLPSEYLDTLWIIIAVLIGGSNVYIYREIYYEQKEMNVYIKNKLECSMEDFTIPTRYKNDYIYKYIPGDEKDLDVYLKYYDIDVYGEERDVVLKFRE